MNKDVTKLKRKIAERGTTLEGIAMLLGIDRSTLYRKLQSGCGGVTVREALKISRYLNLSTDEALSIFWQKNGTDLS